MIKILSLAFVVSLSLTTAAHAEPITAIITAISAIASSIAGGITAIGTAVLGAGAWGTISAFLASPFGSLLVGVGLSLVSSLFTPKQKRSGASAPSIEAGKVNVRITEPERWICAGVVRQGGGAIFGEFDGGGNFWYVVVHSDSILVNKLKVMFDDIEIYTDQYGVVLAPEFCLDPDLNSYGGFGTKVPYFQIWTATYTEDNPTPPGIQALKNAFPINWTDNHKLVGTTYSVIKINALAIENRYKIYKWRGPFGVGEPSVSIVGEWSNAYDPRDSIQVLNNRQTYKKTHNPVLIWAWFRTHRYGRGKSISSINWDKIAEQASICDQMIVGIQATQPRYECGIAIPDSKERSQAEQEILISCDGQLVFDDDGKCWVRVGSYEEPTLRLTRNRDIIGLESVEAQSGESETQGVIVRYLDPDANYSTQPAAAWLNPLYYKPGETPKFLNLEALTCQNHNQAMRLAKAFGMRSQSSHKILPTVSLRGLKARQERIVDIIYDNVFSGPYEIVTTVEVDSIGVFCGFGAVPIDQDRWNLLEGEEKPKPVIADTESAYVLEIPTGVNIVYQNNRIEVTFNQTPRPDWRYKFQYSLNSTEWNDMTTIMADTFAYSGVVAANSPYYVRWQTVSSSGRVSGWQQAGEPIYTSKINLTGGPPTTVGAVGSSYTPWLITASGGTGDYTFVDLYNRLPSGISIAQVPTGDAVASIQGSPIAAGSYIAIVIRCSDAVGNYRDFASFDINVTG